MVQTWYRHIIDMVQTWYGHGTDILQMKVKVTTDPFEYSRQPHTSLDLCVMTAQPLDIG